MEFEVFNRQSEFSKSALAAARLNTNQRHGTISLNPAAVEALGLEPYDTLELLRLGKKWYIVKGIKGNGFSLTQNGAKTTSLRCRAKLTLITLYTDLNTTDIALTFYVKETGHEYKGQKVYEINRRLHLA